MLNINNCIWITGASTGIGKTLALKLARLNYSYKSYYLRIAWIKKYIRIKIREVIKTQYEKIF